ncbi:MAG: glutamine-hydrolyzing GMP synthase [Patescibacteria group bacterium]|nr:glutamine-hydrolyzing GMP synthase [Patescibacteria group bacterium]
MQSPCQLVAILDAGAQYGKVIDRRVRSLHVESIMLPMNTPTHQLNKYSAIIISGGPESVYSKSAPKFDPRVLKLNKPILGICYGMQLMVHLLGGKVEALDRREDGPCTIQVNPKSKLFASLKSKQQVLMSHGDSITQLPAGFTAIAHSGQIVAGIEGQDGRLFGVQFHPEVDLTPNGLIILQNFLFKIAKLSGNFTIKDRVGQAIKDIRQQVGQKQVLVLVSGGVDSTVCATLLRQALKPDQIKAIHIDNGFMRQNESAGVKLALEKQGIQLKVISASTEFFKQLHRVTHPETKRHRIGDTFMRVTKQAIKDLGLGDDSMLAQGTLRPDLIESASKIASRQANAIKTHHNDSPTVRKLRQSGRVIEPLSDYHKDEVREIGRQLGLPPSLVWRQPFPGPGLAIRLLCAQKPYMLPNFKTIQHQLDQFSTPQITATLLPARTVGVQGDGRTYSYFVGLSGERSWSTLLKLAKEIPKQIRQINRVIYIFGDQLKSPVTQITPTYVTPENITQLRQADYIVNQILIEFNLVRKLSQVPVISFPIGFDQPGCRSIAIRTFMTNDFMTGVPALPGQDMPMQALNKMVKQILKQVPGIARVAYDLTSKPPGTTEWE